jgi:hypothetical protein
MRKIFLVLFLTSISTFAQITITGEDVETIFAVGNGSIIHQDTLQSNVDIGTPGGGNTWNFSTLQSNLTVEFTSVNPAATPYFSDFQEATFCAYTEGFSQGYDAEIWTYSTLTDYFNNMGSATTISAFPGNVLNIKNEPPRQTYKNPMTYNSQWNQTYTQTILLNGNPIGTESVSLNVIVDAYGTMTLPGGGSFDALRIRESLTITGITSVTYSFLAINGAQVALFATGSNPPNGGIIGVEEYSWNSPFENNSNVFIITEPEESEILIAGEVNTIAFENAPGNVDLWYRTDFGMEYVLIDTNYFDPDGIYLWDVPESLLTTRAKIKIVESEDTNSVALSGDFKIKPWQFTRLDANDDFELYEPDQDGWSFCNCRSNQWPTSWWQQFNYSGTDPNTGSSYPNQNPFNNAFSTNFPDWPLFVDVFSTLQCYTDDPPSTYSATAAIKWSGVKGVWGGSCAGFSVTSLIGFYYKTSLIQYIGNFDELYSENINDNTRYVINFFQTHQKGNETRSHRRAVFNTSPRQLLNQLKEMLGSDNIDGKTLDYYNNNGSGAHAVIPYKLERIGNTSTFNIRLYNSNAPGSFNQFIYIDSVANTWSDSTSLNWGTGSTGCYLERESSDFFPTPSFDRSNMKPQLNSDNSGSSRLEIYNTPEAEMIITSGTGEQIGYQDSIAFNNIPNAIPIIPTTGSFHPPIGYDLPGNNYSLELDNFIDSVSYVIFFTDSTIYNYRRSNADNKESDLFNFSDEGVGITNPDQIVKIIDFETIILEDTTVERVFVLNGLQISSGDSVHIQEKDRQELLVQNYGEAMNYDLQARIASASGGTNFLHMSIPMTQNSAHQIMPAWTDLISEPITIFIDLGNDGTIDDTIFVKNQATNIEDEGSLISPDSYNLAQNFPNPFNPSTSIRYSIPQRRNVTLKVYDILGNEVASLVNEEKAQGVYTVTFNAGGLSSGIYFYTLRADGFVQTKKMLLLK